MWLCLLLGMGSGLAPRAFTQGPDQHYIHIYTMLQEGDRLLSAGESRAALTKYLEAQKALQRLQATWPDWNPRVVRFRLHYLAERIAEASGRTATLPPAPITAAPEPGPVRTVPDPHLLQELELLRQQVAQLQSDKALLEARLREALSVQPAAADPRELARAQTRIRDLEKEVDLLRIALEEERKRKAAPDVAREMDQLHAQLEQTRRELAEQTELARRLARDKAATEEQFTAHSLSVAQELQRARERITELEQQLARWRALPPSPEPVTVAATGALLEGELAQLRRQLAEQTERAAALARENERLQARLAALGPNPPDPRELELLQQGLAETQRQLAEQQTLNRQLAASKVELESRLARLQADAETLETLRAENLWLRQQLAARSAGASSGTHDLQALQEAQLRLATLQSDLEILRLEKLALEERLQAARDHHTHLTRSHRETLANLQARLATLEAQPVPFTPEELALLRPPQPAWVGPSRAPGDAGPDAAPGSARPVPSLPPEAPAPVPASLEMAETLRRAQQAFAQARYDEAARLCEQVLQHDPRHPLALAHLALALLYQGRPEEAATRARAAVEAAPDLPQPRFVLGQVLFRQGHYRDAVDAFSRAAQADPRSAELQSWLGLALSHQGHRAAAEAALRRAILLEPGYAPAHHNLAVFYLHRDPPLKELARWHYQRARAGGFPPNPELEAALAAAAAPPRS